MTGKCPWAYRDSLEETYHDHVWGRPCHDDRILFEYLILEGMQAGLSWTTIMRKREAMDKAFDHFDLEAILSYDDKKIDSLMTNPTIIRNRRKLEALSKNAKAFKAVQEEWGSFQAYAWSFTEGKVLVGQWASIEQVPSTSSLANFLSKDMKKRGFSFVGPTIVQAFLQAIGVINGHIVTCPSRSQCLALAGESIDYQAFMEGLSNNACISNQ